MTTELQSIFTAAVSQEERIINRLRIVFGDHPMVLECECAFRRAGADWQRTVEQGGTSLPTLAFVGAVNSGKSWLAQQLLTDSEFAQTVFPDGDRFRTNRIIWAGSERPTGLVSAEEQYVAIRQSQMVDLGMPYQILDTPGVGDVNQEYSLLADHALATARLKILVVRQDKLRSENYQDFIQGADGSVVLPVLNLCNPSDLRENYENLSRELEENLGAAIPHATILSPICLVDFEKASTDPARTAREERGKFHQRLREVLADSATQLEAGAAQQLRISIERHRTARTQITASLLDPLREPLATLEAAQRDLPDKALNYLLEDTTKVRLLLRSHLRGLLLEKMPSLAFPFRSVCGLFILTAGAWDRVILGAVGSLPSLFLSGMTAVRNLQATAAAVVPLRDEVMNYLSPPVMQAIREPMEDLVAQLPTLRSELVAPNSFSTPSFEITGIEAFVVQWRLECKSAADASQVGPGKVRLAWALASVIFWFLFAAPLVHTYGQYIPSAIGSWTGSWSPEALASYPAAPAGFWLTALVLAILPVLVIGLLLVSSALSKRRVERAADQLGSAMRRFLTADRSLLSVKISDERVEALRCLL